MTRIALVYAKRIYVIVSSLELALEGLVRYIQRIRYTANGSPAKQNSTASTLDILLGSVHHPVILPFQKLTFITSPATKVLVQIKRRCTMPELDIR